MPLEDAKVEIVAYVQQLETGYTDAVRDLQMMIEREKRASKKVVSEQVNTTVQRSDLESLFMDCIEDVRKDIMRRRLKVEIESNKKF